MSQQGSGECSSESRRLVERCVEQAEPANSYRPLELFQQIRALPGRERLDCLLTAIETHNADWSKYADGRGGKIICLEYLIAELIALRHPWTEEDLTRVAERTGARWCTSTIRQVLDAIREQSIQSPLPPGCLAALRRRKQAILGKDVNASQVNSEDLVIIGMIDEILNRHAFLPLVPGDALAERIRADWECFEPKTQTFWAELLDHAVSLSSSKPTQKWLRVAEYIIANLGKDFITQSIREWLEEVGLHGTRFADHDAINPRVLAHTNVEVVVGLVWICSLLDRDRVIDSLVALACRAFTKVPNHGALAPKVGNACIQVIAAKPGMDSVRRVALVRNSVTNKVLLAHVDKVLEKLAEAAGFDPEYLDELAVPTLGFAADGTRKMEAEGQVTLVCVNAQLKAELQWVNKSGKVTKKAPAELKGSGTLLAARNLAKQADAILKEICLRVEVFLLTRRSWNFADWRERYIDHPLVGQVARRLLWQTEGERRCVFLWEESGPIDRENTKLPLPVAETRLVLWHPAEALPGELDAWALRFKAVGLHQPFDQLERRVYWASDLKDSHDPTLGFADRRFDSKPFYGYFAKRGWVTPRLFLAKPEDIAICAAGSGVSVRLRTEVIKNKKAYEVQRPPYLCLGIREVCFERPDGHSLRVEEVPAPVLSEVLRHLHLVHEHAGLVYD